MVSGPPSSRLAHALPCPTHRSSHLIWTQPGLRRNDQGWYHFSTVCRLEHSTSSHRCRTCSLEQAGKVRQGCLRGLCLISGALSFLRNLLQGLER